jgi:indole-3-glycerol phosphate synthase
LIVAGLESRRLVELKDLVEQLGMTALVETHTESEIMFANDIGSQIIGINARDLETFDTDRSLFGKLSSLVNPRALRVAESAIRNVEDVVEYASFGADCVLVGEAFVTGDSAAMIDSFSQVQKA